MSFENIDLPNVRKEKRIPCNKILPPAYQMAELKLIEYFQFKQPVE